MSWKLALAAAGTLLVGLGIPGPCPASERVIKKDGSVITGEVVGFRGGNYSVRVGDAVVEVPASEVRTIEPASTLPATPAPSPTTEALTVTLDRILEALPTRLQPQVSPEQRVRFEEALARMVRGEWDFALRGLTSIVERDGDWVEPLMLQALLLAERGEQGPALRAALRLETLAAHDALAQQVASEIYRRAQFPRRQVETLERVLRRTVDGPRLDHELTRLWWPVDPQRSRVHWNRYREFDPDLSHESCPEGAVLLRARLALSVADWNRALHAVTELARRFPWVEEELTELQVQVLDTRMSAAEQDGRLEEALICGESLALAAPERAAEFQERVGTLRTFVFHQALRLESFPELRLWCRQLAHLMDATDGAWRAQLAGRFQELAVASLGRGELDAARDAFTEGRTWASDVRPRGLENLLEQVYERARADLQVGRLERVLLLAAVLRDALPERREALLGRFDGLYHEVLGNNLPAPELRVALADLQMAMLLDDGRQPAPGSAAPELVSVPAPAAGTPSNAGGVAIDPDLDRRIQTNFARYFPTTPGTRWVYERGDGVREERRVVSVQPTALGEQITFRVEPQGEDPFHVQVFRSGTDLLLHFETVPPGELALRFPLTAGSSWNWSREGFRFERRLARPTEPLLLPVGAVEDSLVVEGTNRVLEGGTLGQYETRLRFIYAAGFGLVAVECDNPQLARRLIEYQPGPARP